ncbi:MAG: hypothetical protein EOP34_04375 [Rickettsiales bacterium]|nr:MAG: hypothetical protein EOP34_04375 [Rickettsiales bacterium]
MNFFKLNPTSGSEVFLTDIFTHVTYKTPTTPTTPDSNNKPLQGGFDSIWLLLLAYFTKSPEYGKILFPFDQVVTKTDPFFFNMSLLYLNVCEMCILLAVFLFSISLIGFSHYIYYNKLPNLKSFFSKKENAFWVMCARVSIILIITRLIFNSYANKLYILIFSFISFINTGVYPHFYYNPPGLAMGSSRVLHLDSYSQIFSYFNLQYINPDYILYVVTYIKYIAIFIVVLTVYFIIATVTTYVYNTDKTALSLPGGPSSLNLFTKCFYIKSQQRRLIFLLSFFAISLILMGLAAIVLYHYLAIYYIG